jgi:hypothetical protein
MEIQTPLNTLDILVEILSYLKPFDALLSRRVCSWWNKLLLKDEKLRKQIKRNQRHLEYVDYIALAILNYDPSGGSGNEGELNKDFYKFFLKFSNPEKDLYGVQTYAAQEDYIDLLDIEKIEKMKEDDKNHIIFVAAIYESLRCLEKLLSFFPTHDQQICEIIGECSRSVSKLPCLKLLLKERGTCKVCEGTLLTIAVIDENLIHLKALRELGLKYDGHMAIAARGGRIKTMKYIFKDIKTNPGSVLPKRRKKIYWPQY